jgi:hypothetical protein
MVKFGERSDDQSTDCGLISSSRAPSTRMCIRLKYLGSRRMCRMISFFVMDSGTVQVGLRLTAVI